MNLFKTTKEEDIIISKISERALNLMGRDTAEDKIQLSMSLTACHSCGCKLDLEGLLGAPDDLLLHDVIGIHLHLDHETGELKDSFWPKTAKK